MGETCFLTKALATTCLLFGLKTLEFIGLILFGKRVVGNFLARVGFSFEA